MLRMAETKAAAVEVDADTVVLAADTVVVLDNQILGKPADREAGIRMLLALGGREHLVLTAVAADSSGNVGQSDPLTVTVENVNDAPTANNV